MQADGQVGGDEALVGHVVEELVAFDHLFGLFIQGLRHLIRFVEAQILVADDHALHAEGRDVRILALVGAGRDGGLVVSGIGSNDLVQFFIGEAEQDAVLGVGGIRKRADGNARESVRFIIPSLNKITEKVYYSFIFLSRLFHIFFIKLLGATIGTADGK